MDRSTNVPGARHEQQNTFAPENLHKTRKFVPALAKMLESRSTHVLAAIFLLKRVRCDHLNHLAVILRAPGDIEDAESLVECSADDFIECRYDVVQLEKLLWVGQPVWR
jgi:hypothetical protein